MALALLSRNISKFNGNATPFFRSRAISANGINFVKTKISMNKTPYTMTKSICLSAPRLAGPGGSHIGLWTAERIVSVGLVAVVPAAFIMPSQIMDAALAISVMMHQYWGLEAIFTDYLRPGVVGKFASQLAHIMLILVTAATLSGLFYFIYNDIGIAKSIKKIWAIKSE